MVLHCQEGTVSEENIYNPFPSVTLTGEADFFSGFPPEPLIFPTII